MSENTVTLHGREFALEEPSVDVVIRILNAIGSVATRAESHVARVTENPTGRAVLFGLLAVMSEDDLIRLGSAVLQFENDREGRKWLKENGVKVAPLIQAFMINVRLSRDLAEAIRGFFEGVEGLMESVNALLGAITPPQTTSPTQSQG